MMAEVVDQCDAASFAANFHASFNSAEAGEGAADLVRLQATVQSARGHAQRIADIEFASEWNFVPFTVEFERRSVRFEVEVFSAPIVGGPEAEARDGTVFNFKKATDIRIVAIC